MRTPYHWAAETVRGSLISDVNRTILGLFVVVVVVGFVFAFPSYISRVHHFFGEIFAYVTVFFLIHPLR